MQPLTACHYLWLLFHSRIVWTKITPMVGWGKRPQEGAPPSYDELERRRQEAGRLEEAGRSPRSLLTWWLVQMVVEVGTSGGRPTVWGKASTKEFLKKVPCEEALEVLARDSGSPHDLSVSKVYWAPHVQMPLLASRLQNSPRMQKIWPVLPGVYGHGVAGSSGVLPNWPPWRCQPVCHPHKMCHGHA